MDTFLSLPELNSNKQAPLCFHIPLRTKLRVSSTCFTCVRVVNILPSFVVFDTAFSVCGHTSSSILLAFPTFGFHFESSVPHLRVELNTVVAAACFVLNSSFFLKFVLSSKHVIECFHAQQSRHLKRHPLVVIGRTVHMFHVWLVSLIRQVRTDYLMIKLNLSFPFPADCEIDALKVGLHAVFDVTWHKECEKHQTATNIPH